MRQKYNQHDNTSKQKPMPWNFLKKSNKEKATDGPTSADGKRVKQTFESKAKPRFMLTTSSSDKVETTINRGGV